MAIQIQISAVDQGRGVVDVGGVDVPLEELGTRIQFLAVGENPCAICLSYHRTVSDANDMSRPIPQIHRRCVCIEQPYIEGVSPDKQPKFGAMQMWIDGQAPDQAGWSAAKLQAYRKELLGKEASELYAQGKIALDDVITATHERRTLKEIKKRVGKKPAIKARGFAKPSISDIDEWTANSAKFNEFLKQSVKDVDMGMRGEALKIKTAEILDARILALPKAEQDAVADLLNSFGIWKGEYRPGKDFFSPRLIQSWAGTSADNNPLSVFLQQAAIEEFGLTTASMKHISRDAFKKIDAIFSFTPNDKVANIAGKMGMGFELGISKEEAMKGARIWLREMHRETQRQLKAAGITDKITVFRGTKFSDTKDISSNMKSLIKANRGQQTPFVLEERIALQPMSSFSTDLSTALDFANDAQVEVVTVANIPVERILATPTSGFGCLHESELVILGGEEQAWSAFTYEAYARNYIFEWIKALKELLV